MEVIDNKRGIALSYSEFTLRKVKQAFGLNTIEGKRFLPEINPIAPSITLAAFLEETLPLAIAFGTSEADHYWQRKGTLGIDYQSCPG
jgi:hypothetical protein